MLRPAVTGCGNVSICSNVLLLKSICVDFRLNEFLKFVFKGSLEELLLKQFIRIGFQRNERSPLKEFQRIGASGNSNINMNMIYHPAVECKYEKAEEEEKNNNDNGIRLHM